MVSYSQGPRFLSHCTTMPLRYLLTASLLLPGCFVLADEPTATDPYWSLVHDQFVLDDLKLTQQQKSAWREVLNPLDLRYFPLRNKSAAEATEGFAKAAAEAKQQLAKVLTSQQGPRLDQIVVRAQGPAALLREDLATKLKLNEKQRDDIRAAVTNARQSRQKLESELRAAKLETAAAEKQLTTINETERDAVNAVLTNDQKVRLATLFARDFDLSKLGQTAFKAPTFVASSQAWVNAPPPSADDLKDRVLVIHFFAFGCSNCIHNYPTYREWQDKFIGKDVAFIGIHTPETAGEHNVETLKTKLKAENLTFPVLVDNDKANWNAWGNSMWPSVYVLDRRGYMRAFWPGELRWQGATGDKQMMHTIEQLLAEK
jgi:thiol-disulfide isomerase/thioredoxin